MVQLPGRIIQESIHRTRESEGTQTSEEKPSFLHCDDECVLDSSNNLLVVDGKPFDSSKMYTVSILSDLLSGLGEIQPLLDYTKANVQVPDEEMCDEAKEIIVRGPQPHKILHRAPFYLTWVVRPMFCMVLNI